MQRGWKDAILRILQTIWIYLKNILVNIWRRLVIVGKYTFLCWEQQKMCRIYRRLGEQVFHAVEEGKSDILLHADVKAHLDRLNALQAKKTAQREAISQIRERIKATSYALPPRPPKEAPPEAGAPETREEGIREEIRPE